MSLSIDEALILDTLAHEGSIAKTATALGKGASSVIYTMASIEEKMGLPIFDRSGYRTRLLAAGDRLRAACQKLIEASLELEGLCQTIESGFEPDLHFVVEGIVPIEALLGPLSRLSAKGAPTRLHLDTLYLSEVEARFREIRADFMVSLLEPLDDRGLEYLDLETIWVHLVAHRDHPLSQGKRSRSLHELRAHSLLTVKGSDPRLRTPTRSLEGGSTLRFNDFSVKKAAIMRGLGFGWLPEYLIRRELASSTLKLVKWKGESRYAYKPRLYYRGGNSLGRSGRKFLELLRGSMNGS